MRNERIERERDKSFSDREVSAGTLTDPMVNSCCNNK